LPVRGDLSIYREKTRLGGNLRVGGYPMPKKITAVGATGGGFFQGRPRMPLQLINVVMVIAFFAIWALVGNMLVRGT